MPVHLIAETLSHSDSPSNSEVVNGFNNKPNMKILYIFALFTTAVLAAPGPPGGKRPAKPPGVARVSPFAYHSKH